ncbi:hypothetical protein PHYPSEUDO_000305 [Phytophthora pseudosyringae]|uniref:M96 mating-specific protein family n=1 Tax=Phytophthora pseudosyringae TaxID=221518 RepID=A0A8T1VZL1_9STRA|nr:hypothetical protein PHYPSEUDO_000305 [Phytophthora pseudosyringae]
MKTSRQLPRSCGAWKTEPSISAFLSSVPAPIVKGELPPASKQAPAKPKKKRVRRQKLELEYLRGLVGKLEQQMTQLQATQREDGAQTATIKSEPKGPSIWKGIAERQQKERARVEEKNQKLRVSLEGQLKLATKLETLLRKRPRDKEVAELAGCKRYKPLVDTAVAPTEDEVFADQLAHVNRAHLDADEIFGGPEFADRAASFCDLYVTNDSGSDTGVAFVTKAISMLPFDIQVTEKAFWRAFGEEGPKKLSYFHEERLSTENVVARSYALNFTAGSIQTHVRGKQTYRKYVGDDYVMILWKSQTEPVEIDGVKLSGLRCNQIGWIVLRGVNLATDDAQYGLIDTSKTMMSTSLQSYCKMTLELQDDIADQELQVGALTNFVVNSHDAITDVCGKLINEVLVEEDWNINGWLDNLAL